MLIEGLTQYQMHRGKLLMCASTILICIIIIIIGSITSSCNEIFLSMKCQTLQWASDFAFAVCTAWNGRSLKSTCPQGPAQMSFTLEASLDDHGRMYTRIPIAWVPLPVKEF